jgi:hypothetical protein
MVDIRTSCYAARLAAFSYPQKHWKALIFRGALKYDCHGLSSFSLDGPAVIQLINLLCPGLANII